MVSSSKKWSSQPYPGISNSGPTCRCHNRGVQIRRRRLPAQCQCNLAKQLSGTGHAPCSGRIWLSRALWTLRCGAGCHRSQAPIGSDCMWRLWQGDDA